MTRVRIAGFVTLAATLVVTASAGRAHALLSSQELKCSAALAKSVAKFEGTVLKETSKCRANEVLGKTSDLTACSPLRVASEAKVATARAKLVASAAKSCQSVCSISNDKVCIDDLDCPPNKALAERCTGKGGSKPFSIGKLGFPGPYCAAMLGHAVRDPEDIGNCMSALADRVAVRLMDNLYGGVDHSTGISADAAKCLSSVTKAVTKSVGKMHRAVAKCRNVQQGAPVCVGGSDEGKRCTSLRDCSGGSCGIDASACALKDPKTIAAVSKEDAFLQRTVEKSCTNDTIGELFDLCQAGSPPATVAEAQACVVALAREIGASVEGPSRHVYAPYSLVQVTNPDAGFAYCGDGVVDQARSEGAPTGEECDGDDTPCGDGHCLPPGDLFECTCDNVPRERLMIEGDRVDSDTGWTGASHDATHNDGFGFVADLSDCNCDQFDQATCVGVTTAPVCTEAAATAPRCSDRMDSALSCDQLGDNDGTDEAGDCFACDADSANAGAYCGDGKGGVVETVCQSQCIDDLSGDVVGTCERQADCGDGRTCRGRCDSSATCRTISEGTPLPLVSAATPVCVQNQYVSDVVGTKDMVTGAADFDYITRTEVFLGGTKVHPCPLCGGTCVGGDKDLYACMGRCDASQEPCLLDGDCTGAGDTSCLEADADCPGGRCSLDLRCSGGENAGRICRPMANTPFGVVSADCPPSADKNLTGFGVVSDFGHVTTGTVRFPAGDACSDPGWHNYTCPCPDGGSKVQTAPNSCAAACDGGTKAGQGCALTGVSAGVFTVCVDGSDAGAVCDEDADCEGGGSCSGTPSECVAGKTAKIGQLCTSNPDCDTSAGSGDGVCESSCPGGRCVPLCYPEGTCDGGTRAGQACATEAHCPQGTCVVTNAEDGLCAAGAFQYRCSGERFRTLPCAAAQFGTQAGCEAGDDGKLGTADDLPGAGVCQSRPRDCFYNDGEMEGGDTDNGNGDPSDVKYVSAFCIPPAPNDAINGVSGFGGPGKLTRYGRAFVNVPSIP